MQQQQKYRLIYTLIFAFDQGGGLSYFIPNTKDVKIANQTMGLGARKDGIDLIEKWKEQKSKQYSNDRKYKFVDTVQALNEVDANEVDHLFGLFNV